jgi:hypothetical protein
MTRGASHSEIVCRHCEERRVRRSSTSEGGSDEAIHAFFARQDGLLRGACHRARIRATRWLAMTGSGRTRHTLSRRRPRKRAIQYSGTLAMELEGRGVLDTPPEPVIGLAEGETRWRV